MKFGRRKWIACALLAVGLSITGYLLIQLFLSSPLGGLLFPDQWVQRQQRAHQEPFTFYGKVVDAAGQPIAGAELELVVRLPGSEPNQKDRVVVTDQHGRFELSDKGSQVWVMEVRGAGHLLYDRNTSQVSSDGFIKHDTRSYSFSRTGQTFTYVPDQNDPAVFVVVQNGDLITAWPSRGGRDVHVSTGRTPPPNLPRRPREPSVDIIDTPQGPVAGEVYNRATRRYPGRD